MKNNVWQKMKPKTHQHSKSKSRFEELEQDIFRQDLQSPSLYGFYSDSCTDFCGLFGMIVSLVIAISVVFFNISDNL